MNCYLNLDPDPNKDNFVGFYKINGKEVMARTYTNNGWCRLIPSLATSDPLYKYLEIIGLKPMCLCILIFLVAVVGRGYGNSKSNGCKQVVIIPVSGLGLTQKPSMGKTVNEEWGSAQKQKKPTKKTKQ